MRHRISMIADAGHDGGMKISLMAEEIKGASPVKFWLYTRGAFALFVVIQAAFVYCAFKYLTD